MEDLLEEEEVEYSLNLENHFKKREPFTESDLEYLCKFFEQDGRQMMAFALRRTEATISSVVTRLKREGLYEHYKTLNKHW
jgi:hypothetical protein